MYTIINRITMLYILSTIAVGQLRSELPAQSVPVNIHGVSHARNTSLFDMSRLSISNSFGMSMTSFGNQSISVGSYNSNINYLINDKVRLSSQFSLMAPMGGINPNAQNGLNGAKLFYNTSIDYKPTDSMLIKFSMNNYPRYYRNPYSRFLLTK
tara:strand:+ start:4041 stop:4502 length:462 start_codon:yes stop_codon:yes gene_type:complete